MLQFINRFIGLSIDSFKLFKNGKAWLLLAVIGLIDYLLLFAHYKFYSPLFYSSITTWVDLVNKDYAIGFTHYPGHLMLLPYYFYQAKLVVGIFIEGIILGGVAMVFYRSLYDLPRNHGYSFSRTGKQWLHLSLAWLLLNGLMYLAGTYLPQIFEPFLLYSPRRQMVFDYVLLPSLNIIFFALLYITIPYITIYNAHVLSGLKNSILFFIKQPIFMLFISLIILLPPTILSFILMNQQIIIDKFVPDLIYWIIVMGLFIDLFINFLWMGSAVELIVEEE